MIDNRFDMVLWIILAVGVGILLGRMGCPS